MNVCMGSMVKMIDLGPRIMFGKFLHYTILESDLPGGGGRVIPGDRSECVENVRESKGK